MKLNVGQYAKLIVAAAGACTQLLTHYSGQWWEPPVAATVTAIVVYLVPNAGQPPKA